MYGAVLVSTTILKVKNLYCTFFQSAFNLSFCLLHWPGVTAPSAN